MPMVPLGPWLPDLPDYANPGSNTMLNCVPRTLDSYGPAPMTAPVTGTLVARCQGAIYVRDKSGNVHGFAGDATKLYTNVSGSTNWVNITRVLPPPLQAASATATTGGTLAAATYFYVVTALNAQGQTIKSNEISQITTGTTSTVTVNWGAVAGATGYRVYRGTAAGAENVFYAVGVVVSYLDTGSASTGGTPPVANTATVPYSTGADERWEFSVFGERIIATNFTDDIQSFVMGVSTAFSQLSPDAPKARYVAQVKDFLMVANTSDGTDGPVPQRVWWPAIDDPTNWPTIGSDVAAEVQSDQQDLVGIGGWDQGIVGGLSSADAVIFQERAIFRAVYIGPPAIFSFSVLSGGRGTPAPGSIVQVGEQAFYLADNGFYVTDGLQSVPIGAEQVDKTFWSLVDQNNLFRISAAADPLNKLIYWAFPGPQNTAGAPNYIIVYNYELKRWSLIQQMTEIMVRALTTGYTLEQLNFFGNLETLPFSLDSRAWTGGRLNLACFDPTHAMALFSGAALPATMDTSEANLNDKGLAHINRTWPMVDAVPGLSGAFLNSLFSGTTPPITVSIGQRNRLADPVMWGTPSAVTATTGSAPLRSTAVFQRARVQIVAGASWQNAQGINFDWRPAGNR